jgi:hypothetical protein
MGAHPDNTWRKRVSSEDSERYVSWLEDAEMLPAAIPNARIMRYGYRSEWFGKGAIRTKAPIISRQLLPELRDERKVSACT